MDTSIFCVYNLERRVFLSSKVTIVDGVAEPLKALRLLVSGLGANAESGLWLTNLIGMPAVPKLFPYDLACLDKDLRVIETIEILPGVEFPQYRRDVSSAVLLPPDTLRTTQTRVGDRLLISTQEQIDQLLADSESTSRIERIPAALESPTAVPVEVAAMLSPEQTAGGQPANSAESPVKPQNPAVPITEALEKTDSSVREAQPGAQHRWSVEDLFANWVDSPAAPPSWIAQKAREHATTPGGPGTPNASGTKNPENRDLPPEKSATPPEELRSKIAESKQVPAGPAEPKEPGKSSAPVEPRAPQRVPQPPQKTSFTIAQYGMWQVSPPRVSGSMPSVKSPTANGSNGQSPAKRDAGWKREEPTKRENGVVKKANGFPRSVVSRPKDGQAAAASTEKPAAPAPEVKRADSPAVPAASASAVPRTKVESPVPETLAEEPKSITNPVSDSGFLYKAGSQSSAAHVEQTRSDEKTTAPSKSGSPPADFEMAVQDKLDRIQLKAPTTNAGASPSKPGSTFGKKASTEQPEPPLKPSLEVPRAATKPPANSDARKAGQEQRGTAIAQPLKPKPTPNAKPKNAVPPRNAHQKNEAEALGLGAKFKRWLSPGPSKASDRRRAHRRYVPGVVAHYFTGGAPKPHEVSDISMTGMYVETDDRWLPDTMIRMTLQKPCARGDKKQSITVLSRIVRRGSDGVAAEFVMEETLDPNSREILPSHATDRFALARFL